MSMPTIENCAQVLKEAFFSQHFPHFLGHGESTTKLYIKSFFDVNAAKGQLGTGTGVDTGTVQFEILKSLTKPLPPAQEPEPETRPDDIKDSDLETGPRLYVVLGESGIGKTTLALALVNELWDKYDEHAIIPVYIDLGSVASPEAVLTKYLENLGLQSSALKKSPVQKRVIVVLDSYDELTTTGSSGIKARMEKLAEDLCKVHNVWKIVLLTRAEALPANRYNKVELWSVLNPATAGKALASPSTSPSRTMEFDLSPFTPEQVRLYIENFFSFIDRSTEAELNETPWKPIKELRLRHGSELEFGAKEIFDWLTKLPELLRLAGNPYILSLIMLCLPRLYFRTQGQDHDLDSEAAAAKKICATKVEVFDSFTTAWFNYQAIRLRKTNPVFSDVFSGEIGLEYLKGYLRTYAQNLAQVFLNANGLLTGGFILFGSATLKNEHKLAEPQWHNPELRKLYYGSHSSVFPTAARVQRTDTDSENEPQEWLNLKALRTGCLIHVRGTTFRFFHRSLVEYFAAREFFDGFASVLDYQVRNVFTVDDGNTNTLSFKFKDGIQRELIRDPDILHQLAERAQVDHAFRERLYEAIEKSANVQTLATMSSNSITILNLARLSLSGRNFRHVQIPSANLQHALCGGTDFRGADLSNVQFKSSWLVGAKFQGANLMGANFGETLQLFVSSSEPVSVFHVVFVNIQRSTYEPCWVAGFTERNKPERFKVGCWTASLSATMSQMIQKWTHCDEDEVCSYMNENKDLKYVVPAQPHFQVLSNESTPGAAKSLLITCLRAVKIWSFDGSGRLQATIDTRTVTLATRSLFRNLVLDPSMGWIAFAEGKVMEVWSLSRATSSSPSSAGQKRGKQTHVGYQSQIKLCEWNTKHTPLPGRLAPDIRGLHYDSVTACFVVNIEKELIVLRLKYVPGRATSGKPDLCECAQFFLDRFVVTIAFGHLKQYFAFGDSNMLKIYRYTTSSHEFDHMETIADAHLKEIRALSFSNTCEYLASGGMDADVNIWKTSSWEFLIKLDGFTTNITSIAFQRNAEATVAIASEDTSFVRLVNLLSFAGFSSEEQHIQEAAMATTAENALTPSRSMYWYLNAVCVCPNTDADAMHLTALVYRSRHDDKGLIPWEHSYYSDTLPNFLKLIV